MSDFVCVQKNGKLRFSEKTDIFDGEYIYMPKLGNEFMLYTPSGFEKVRDAFEKSGEVLCSKHVSTAARYFLSRAALVNIKNGSFEIGRLEDAADVYEVSECSEGLRFVAVYPE